MTGSARPTIRVLEDRPADSDAFGSHDEIARALEGVIKAERGGKAVALLGQWDSGKSTVVRLLAARLNPNGEKVLPKSDDVAVVVFDAWSHEGDPLRRAFLEELIGALTRRHWIAGRKWARKLEELRQKRSNTEIRSTPHLTTFGKCVALPAAGLATLVPLGTALIAGAPNSNDLQFEIGAALSLAPILWALVVGLLFKLFAADSAEGSEGVLSLFANRMTRVEAQETLTSADPTTLEFEAWFQEIADEAITGGRKLVLVIDNLDRVNTQVAIRLWSVMQTFLDLAARSSLRWAQGLWVVAPFDRDGLRRLWNRDNGDDARTFLDKTFQLQLRLAPPVLSDWRTFLMDQLALAFPDLPQSERYDLVQIFAVLREPWPPPTPRHLKIFSNRLALLSAAAPADVPLTSQAAFILIGDIAPDWRPGVDIPMGIAVTPYLPSDYLEDLAALSFGVPKSKSLQVFYGEKIEGCLNSGLADDLIQIGADPGLPDAIATLLDQRVHGWVDNDPRMLGRAAALFRDAELPDGPEMDRAWLQLDHGVAAAKDWRDLESLAGRGLGMIVERGIAKGLPATLVAALSGTSLRRDDGQDPNLKERAEWMKGLSHVLRAVAANAEGDDILAGFRLAANPAEYLKMLAAIEEASDFSETLQYLAPNQPPESVLATVVAEIKEGELQDETASALETMQSAMPGANWKPVPTALGAWLQTGDDRTDAAIARAIRALFSLRARADNADKILRTLVSTGWVFHFYQKHDASGISTPWCTLLALMFEPAADTGNNPGDAANGRNTYRSQVTRPGRFEELFDTVADLAVSQDCVGALLEQWDTAGDAKPAFDRLVAKWLEHEDADQLISGAQVLERWPDVARVLGDSAKAVVSRLAAGGDLVEALCSSSFDPSNTELYRLVSKDSRVRDWLCNGLRELEEAQWTAALSEDDPLIGLVEDLASHGVSVDLGIPAGDALRDYANGLSSGSRTPSETRNLDRFAEGLAADQRAVLGDTLRDLVTTADETVRDLLAMFPKALGPGDGWVGDADRLVRDAVRKMIERGDSEELEWAADLLEQEPRILKSCPRHVVDDFKRRIGRAPAMDQEGARAALTRLATHVGVELVQPED